jgi:Tfp pilus assembly PilM family ATPase
VLEAGVRGIAGEVRNSLDFYQAQEGAGQLSLVVLSGPALDIPGFAEMLEQNLGLEVASETVPTINPDALRGLSPQYFAIAAGLAVEEVRE